MKMPFDPTPEFLPKILSILLLPMLLHCLATPAHSNTGMQDHAFPVPNKMRTQVRFWEDIFTKYSTDQVVIHDNWYMNVIFEVMDIGKYPDEKTAWNVVQARKQKYMQILNNLSKIWNEPQRMTKAQRRVFRLYQTCGESAYFKKKDAKYRVRAQSGLSDIFREGIVRSGRYIEPMTRVFEKHGLPDALVRLPFVESAFDPRALSKSGAAGVWQFMKGTGKLYGLKITRLVDERKDPMKATEAAAKLLSDNYAELRSWPLALTAYNHGLNGMKRAVRKTGSGNISDIVEKYNGRGFSFASRNFYAEFIAASNVYAKRHEYFGNIDPEETLSVKKMTLLNAVSVDSLKKYFRISERELRKLNPALHASVFMPGGIIPVNYQFAVPRNPEDEIATGMVYFPASDHMDPDHAGTGTPVKGFPLKTAMKYRTNGKNRNETVKKSGMSRSVRQNTRHPVKRAMKYKTRG